MPTLPVPLFAEVYRNVDGEELRDKNYELVDGYLDEMGYSVKRPGLTQLLDLGYGTNISVDGIFWWPQKQCAIAVCNNKVHKLTYSSGTLSSRDITTNGPGTAALPVFCVGVDSNVSAPVHYGLIAAGGQIIQSNGTGSTTSNFATIADGDAPTTVSHVDFIDGYVLATTGKGMFQFSDLNNPTSWAALSFATAMRNPDNIVALKVFRRQVYLIGKVSTEIWENDGASPFSPSPGGFFEAGCIAPYSVVVGNDATYWLNDDRQFVSLSDEGLKRISTPYDKEIADFSAVADCIGQRIKIRGKSFLIFQFVTAERTLVYNLEGKNWSEWKYWDSNFGEYKHFIGKSYCYAPDWGLHLVGSRADGKIYAMSPSYQDDAGTPIRMRKVTGHIDFGTVKRKRSRELRIRMKRGQGLTSGEPQLMIRWNDDNRGWSNEHTISLGNLGDREVVKRFDCRGVYRTRQWEFVATDAVGVSFGAAEEDVDVL